MGKGGGGSAPQTTTAYQTNLPEYAKPYVMNMLGAAQNQLFTTTPGTTDAQGNTTPGEITGFKPYTPYSNDPTQYFAGPSSLQQSAYNAAGQLQSPSQYQVGSQLAGMSGMGQLGTAGQAGMYGQQGAGLGLMGAMYGMPAFGAGQQYAQQVTDPNAFQSYMSPYQQAVTDVAKNAAVREAQIAGNQANLGAARQGTYGGARQALAASERERNLLGNLSNIQAQGSQSAFDRAMQAQQFGANLGLQGIQTGLQGLQTGMQGIGQGLQGVGAQQAGYAGAGQAASTLGQLGTQQSATDLQNINLQNQLGGQQQQYQQNIINQAIQDYATQQQYPFMQLSTMSNLLRGLPMQGMTTQQYQAAPSAISQLGGLGATALGAYGASGGFKAAGGGQVKSYAKGGKVASYAPGGVVGGVEAQLMQMDIPQLTQVAKTSPSVSIRQKAAEILAQKQMAAQSKQAMGIDTLPAGNLDDIGMAGGGIVAFQNGGETYTDPLMALSGLTPEMLAEDEERRRRPKARNFYQESLGYLPERPAPGNVATGIGNAVPPVADVVAKKQADEKTNKSAGIAAPAEGKYEKEIEAGLAELKKGLSGGMAQKDLDALRENIKENQDQKFWMSLIQGGAKAMQSTSPHAMVGLGAGIEEGAKSYGKGIEAERADKKLLIAQQGALEQVEYARKSGNLNALIAAQGRLDALKSQRENLAANKELAILSARDKAYGDLVGRLYVQTQDIDQAKAMADKIYSSTNLGGMPGGSKLPEGVVVRQITKG